jgi:hypothetical protein
MLPEAGRSTLECHTLPVRTGFFSANSCFNDAHAAAKVGIAAALLPLSGREFKAHHYDERKEAMHQQNQ